MFLNDRGIGHVLTGVRRPPTIGKVESRLWRDTLNRELIKRFRFKDQEEAQEAFSAIGRSLPAKDLPDKDWQAGASGGDAYRFYHNHEGSHQALGNLSPISRYKFVQRQSPQSPVPIFCPSTGLRKVRGNGCITFNGNEIYISEILIGKMVKIEQNKNSLDIYYDKNLIKSVTYVS